MSGWWRHPAKTVLVHLKSPTLHAGLPGRHVEKKRTLDLFPIMQEPKIEGLDLYTYVFYMQGCVYICIYVSGSS